MKDDELHPTVRAFLDALDLPTVHPYIDDVWTFQGEEPPDLINVDHHKWSLLDYFVPSKVESGSSRATPYRPENPALIISPNDDTTATPYINASPATFAHFEGSEKFASGRSAAPGGFINSVALALSTVRHMWRQVMPCISSTFHLCFLRLFCPLLWSFAMAYLMAQPLVDGGDNRTRTDKGNKAQNYRGTIYRRINLLASLTALLTAMTMMTDTMYVLEFTRLSLVALYAFTVAVVILRSPSRKRAAAIVLPMMAASAIVWTVCDIDLPTSTNPELRPGLYYDETNPFAAAIANGWDAKFRTYDDGRGTPWLVNGDTRTGIPFVVNHLPEQCFVRRWLPTEVCGETEAVIIDIAFPSDGIHRSDKPLYLLLHGLNGGSNEGYIRDFIMRRRDEGCTIAVMVTRGLMDSPILGDNLPHFVRTDDIASAARALRRASGPAQTVAAVGYSMGAISLANYVARSGPNCNLDAAVALSGALDTRVQLHFKRSTRLWQPFLAKTLRETITGKFMDRLRKRLSPEQIVKVEEASSIIDLDRDLFVPYNGFDDIEHYYSELGAMGDWKSFDGSTADDVGRIANVSVPLLTVNALDDPIGDPRCLRDPGKVVRTGGGNVFVLLTRRGGHVGWPLGMNPAKEGWRWMSDVASSFVESVDRARKSKGPR